MPILIERARDHLSILTDTVRLVFVFDLLIRRPLLLGLVDLCAMVRFVLSS